MFALQGCGQGKGATPAKKTSGVATTNYSAKASKQDDAYTQFFQGCSYAYGLGVAKDEVEAAKWYRKAAEQGLAVAQNNLGYCYDNGLGVAKDEVEAAKWYRKAAEQGEAIAQFNLGSCYSDGQGVSQDYAEAVKWYQKAAEQGRPDAEYNLGLCYYYGHGVPEDTATAARWFLKAANQGDAPAENNIGALYFHGKGVMQDYAEATKWFRKAADQGSVAAQFSIGMSYWKGFGIPQDDTEAEIWLRKAAEQGNAEAQYSLGVFYSKPHSLKGRGIIQDYVEAAKWYEKAAEQGRPDAQHNLGLCYVNGWGVKQDMMVAAKWMLKAADQGLEEAEWNAGVFYGKGEGVPQNDIEAYKWFSLAASQGNEHAAKTRDLISQRMGREEIAEGQRRAYTFVAKPESPDAQDSFTSKPKPLSVDGAKASGTGFFITEDGYLITNNHVVKDAAQVRLVTSAGLIDAKVVQVDAANDLALLKAEGKFFPLPIVSSRTVHLGGTVATIGFPDIGLQGFAPKLAKGEIASLSGAGDDARYFQVSVPVQPGNSGGALVDEHGNVIGIVSAKLSARAALAESGALPENVNYAVKSSLLLSFLESVPDVANKLKAPVAADRKFEEVVKSAQDAAVLVLVY